MAELLLPRNVRHWVDTHCCIIGKLLTFVWISVFLYCCISDLNGGYTGRTVDNQPITQLCVPSTLYPQYISCTNILGNHSLFWAQNMPPSFRWWWVSGGYRNHWWEVGKISAAQNRGRVGGPSSDPPLFPLFHFLVRFQFPQSLTLYFLRSFQLSFSGSKLWQRGPLPIYDISTGRGETNWEKFQNKITGLASLNTRRRKYNNWVSDPE